MIGLGFRLGFANVPRTPPHGAGVVVRAKVHAFSQPTRPGFFLLREVPDSENPLRGGWRGRDREAPCLRGLTAVMYRRPLMPRPLQRKPEEAPLRGKTPLENPLTGKAPDAGDPGQVP